ncbi:hypothetical protein JCM3774_005443 [Rhodotorula dairenensis]
MHLDEPLLEVQALPTQTFDSRGPEVRPHAQSDGRPAHEMGEASYFSLQRWYGTLGQSGSSTSVSGEVGAPSDEITQQFRRAIRRAREADGQASTASSCSSESYDTCVDSPASSTTTWDTSSSETSADKEAAADCNGPTPPRSIDVVHGSRALRTEQSIATLRAPRVLRKSASCASLTSTSVQVPPRSPYTVSSPTFAMVASPLLDQNAWSSGSPSGTSAFACPSPSPSQSSTFGSQLASSLRKSASSFTLRLSARSPDPPPPMPSPPSFHPTGVSAYPNNDLPVSSSSAMTAADRLRDILLQHDAVVDPSTEPITPLFDPKLARTHGHRTSDSDESSSEDEGEAVEEEGRPFHDEEQEALEVERLLRGGSSAMLPRTTFDPDSSDEDDPFAVSVRPGSGVWMAPTPFDPSTPASSSVRAPTFLPLDADDAASESPSRGFPPFDPYGFAFGDAPIPLPPPPRPPRPTRTKVITKKRSFVDPRTRRIRTAPTVTITPSTPEKQRTRY